MFNSKIVPPGWWMGLRRIGKGRRPQWDVVLHHPQTLVPSSGSTTSVGPDGLLAAGTWCFTTHKPLFLRTEAPRLSAKGPPAAMGRGASPPANPCSFVRRHHVCRLKGRRPQWDVVLHHPQTLVPSSGSTTSVGPDGLLAAGTWCFTARKPLFLRTEAPRLSVRMSLRRRRRGASLPAKPCSFVRRHHVCRSGWAFGGWDVVLHRPQTLIPSYGSTTSVGSDGMRWETARPFPFLSPHKERNSAGRKARCCSFIILIFFKKRKNRRLPNFPGSFPPSIFSAGELNFCVRDGNRCILSAIITGFSLFVF